MEKYLARSLTYLLTPSKITCDKIVGGGRDQNRDIHLTFLGPRLQRYVTITKPHCAWQLAISPMGVVKCVCVNVQQISSS